MEELLTAKPKIGVFLRESSGQLTLNHRGLRIELDDKSIDKSARVVRLGVKNTGNEVLHINSFQIGEFWENKNLAGLVGHKIADNEGVMALSMLGGQDPDGQRDPHRVIITLLPLNDN